MQEVPYRRRIGSTCNHSPGLIKAYYLFIRHLLLFAYLLTLTLTAMSNTLDTP